MKFKELTQFGKIIPGLEINGKPAPYPVLNERAVRATAGIMLIVAIFGFTRAYYIQDFLPLKIIVISFLIDFGIKIFLGPTLSPYSYLGRLVTKNQKPEYVGAIQKRFAWSIGFTMALLMTILFVIMGLRGTIPIAFCSVCLLFMFLETSFGICVGCKIYWKFVEWKIIKEPEHAPACPGGACPIPKKKK